MTAHPPALARRPRSRPWWAPHGAIERDKLVERLAATPAGGVALLCAPAGSGKSALVRSWVDSDAFGDRVAWVTVERDERDGQRFWLSVMDETVAAVGCGCEAVAEGVSPTPSFFAGELIAERLLACLATLQDPCVLVLDDLHELGSSDALRSLELFLGRLPAQVRVVITTRVDPRLGLHRLRVTGALTEIRDGDLRFSLSETRELLAASGIALSDHLTRLLHDRTEGWAAGLRLAAIALADEPDPERFVNGFCGSERTVADYLLAEVLEHQPPEVRHLLLRTSVLDRVSGPLADALTGGVHSERILQRLADTNAFVTPLDAGRWWFRYHGLFAELLRRELRRTAPGSIDALHRAASRWLADHGFIVDAIRHAQAVGDWAEAARLLAAHHVDLMLDGRLATVRALLADFPAGAYAGDAELAVIFATGAIFDGSPDECAAYLDVAERLAGNVPDDRRRRLDLQIATAKVWRASWMADTAAAVTATRSLEAALQASAPEELALEKDLHATALLHLGTAELWASRLDDAQRDLEHAYVLARRARRPFLQFASLAPHAIASVLNGGKIADAVEQLHEALAIAESHGWGDNPLLGGALAGGGVALVWLGRFDEAERWLDRAQDTLRPDGEPGAAFVLHYGRGVLHFAQGRYADARDAFVAAQRVTWHLASEHALSVELCNRLVQTYVALDDRPEARAVLTGLSADVRDRTEIRVAQAALELAEGRPGEAVEVLGPALYRTKEPIRLTWARIQALVHDAAARQQLGDACLAEASLERALELAAPELVVLPFTSPVVRDLVKRHARCRMTHPALVAAILDVLADIAAPPCDEATAPLGELSEAELRVLSHLPSKLTCAEIAAELYVSVNTIRTHVRHIYAKLDVHTRTEAVGRARALGLLLAR